MKIEILKSAKGNEQNKINLPNLQIPNPQNPGSPICQEKAKQGKSNHKIGLRTQQTENSSQLL